MPIYEFECMTCGDRFDRLQKLSDPDPTDCPQCGATGVRRRLTAPSFRLSGSGWYETDFKKDSDKKRNLVDKAEPGKYEKPAASESASASATATDSKPKESTSSEKPKPAAAAPKPEPSQGSAK